MAPLVSNLSLSVHSLLQEERYDTDDTKSGQVYEIFVPQSRLSARHRPCAVTIVHRSRTGKQIERLRCTVCGRAFSERAATSPADVTRTKAASLPKAA